jgi:exopolyphosphatase/guanosine-5'-triphosphate,3'-diphosphate pyrophosphatase
MKNGPIKLRRGPGMRVGAARRQRQDDGGGVAYAALDLGTNNCRLLVATPDGAGFRVLDAFSRIVRLGEGLDRDGRLSDAAIERTISALRICASKMVKKRVIKARNVATEACRRAANCQDFVDRVQGETGLEFEIISPEEEATLALVGCAPLLVDDHPYGLVFDIGGGSTEIMWAERGCGVGPHGLRLIDSLSIPLGVVSLAEHHGGDRISNEAYEAMIERIDDQISAFEARNNIRAHISDGTVQMLGTSGTVTTLAGIHLKLPSYDRNTVDGCFLNFDEIDTVTRHLLSLDFAGRATEPCIGEARADLVVAGCAILDAICRNWPVGRLRVADRGVREGILFNLMGLGGATVGVH